MINRIFYLAAGGCLLLAAFFQFFCIGYGTLALTLFFGAFCCVVFGLLWGRKEKPLRRLFILFIALLVVGFGCFMAAETPVLLGSRSDPDTAADYAIVMGAGVNGTVPSLSLRNRLEAALVWLEENPDGVAILSGAIGAGDPISEAQCMFNWLTERGIDPGRLVLEEEARNSYQNLRNSIAIIERLGGDPTGTVAVVSSDYHLCRIRMLGGHFGFTPVCHGSRTPYVSFYINAAIREAFALWEIWVFGYGA